MADDSSRGNVPGRISQIEGEVGSLKGEVGSLKQNVSALDGKVTTLSADIAHAERRSDERHGEATRAQQEFINEWRNQKAQEEKSEREDAKSRRIGPMQVVQLMATSAALLGFMAGLFFFLVKAYLDGSTTPAIAQLTERQNATTESNIRRDSSIDMLRVDLTRITGAVADIRQIADDNKVAVEGFRELAAKSADERARLDERVKAQRELFQVLGEAEANARKAGDDALRDELRQFKARAAPTS